MSWSWPLMTPPVPALEIPIFNAYYLDLCRTPCDPTMVWGTEVETSALEEYLQQVNRHSPILISASHVLLQAVGRALALHPQFNRRVLRRRVYEFTNVNVLMALRKRRGNEADVFLLRNADTLSLVDIAQEVWRHNRQAARGRFAYERQERLFRRLPRPLARWLLRVQSWTTDNLNLPARSINERLRCAPVLVNYLAFRGAPPMRAFKPSRFPSDSCTLNIAMGPTERKPVALGRAVEVRAVAPLFVRADHRIVDAQDLGRFVTTLSELLRAPHRMDSDARPANAVAIGPATRGCRARFPSTAENRALALGEQLEQQKGIETTCDVCTPGGDR